MDPLLWALVMSPTFWFIFIGWWSVLTYLCILNWLSTTLVHSAVFSQSLTYNNESAVRGRNVTSGMHALCSFTLWITFSKRAWGPLIEPDACHHRHPADPGSTWWLTDVMQSKHVLGAKNNTKWHEQLNICFWRPTGEDTAVMQTINITERWWIITIICVLQMVGENDSDFLSQIFHLFRHEVKFSDWNDKRSEWADSSSHCHMIYSVCKCFLQSIQPPVTATLADSAVIVCQYLWQLTVQPFHVLLCSFFIWSAEGAVANVFIHPQWLFWKPMEQPSALITRWTMIHE